MIVLEFASSATDPIFLHGPLWSLWIAAGLMALGIAIGRRSKRGPSQP